MKAVLLTTNYPPVGGGVSRYNAGLVDTARPHIAVAGRDKFLPPPQGDKLLIRLAQVLWAFMVSRKVPKEAVILASQPHLAVGVSLAGRRFTMFIHGGEWEDWVLGKQALRFFSRLSQRIVFSSVATMNRFNSEALSTKSIVIRPGLCTQISVSKAVSSRQIAEDSGIRILCVGRLSPRKGHRKLISAVQLCRSNGLRIRLTIVGTGVLEDELRSLTSPTDEIRFETRVSDDELIRFYDEADIFAMLPEEISGGEAWEGFGIVFLEAASRGLPIVATRSGGVPEATCDDGAVLLPEHCSAHEVADTISSLSLQPEVRAKMSLANLKWAAGNSWESRRELVCRLIFPNDKITMQ